MAYNLEPRTIKENLLGLIGKNPHAEPRPANTREECFLADIAENGGGTGGLPEVTSDDNGDFLGVVDGEWDKVPAPSSLPPYTSADKGKVLTVGEGEPVETVVVIPVQTVTLDPETATGTLTNTSGSLNDFSEGDTFTLIVDGEPYEAVAQDDRGEIVITTYPAPFTIFMDGESWAFTNTDVTPGESATFTVSLTASVPSVEPKWEAASGGGGFPKIHMTSGLQPSLVSTYDEILAIYQTGSAAMLWDDDNSLDMVVLYPTPEIVQSEVTVRGYGGVLVNGFRDNSTSTTITTYSITLGDDGNTQDAVITQVTKTVALSGGIS